MTTDRLDLGPHRWMAAGGLAFIHVRLCEGRALWVTAAPVRDFSVTWSVFSQKILWLGPSLILLLLFLGYSAWGIYAGQSGQHRDLALIAYAILAIAFACYRLVRRLGKATFHFGNTFLDESARLHFPRRTSRKPEFVAFTEFLKQLKRGAGDGLRGPQIFTLSAPWFGFLVAQSVVLLVGSVALVYFWADYRLAIAVLCLIATGATAYSAIRDSIFVSRELREVRSRVLQGDVDGGIALLKPYLAANPTDNYATELMVIADLMRCNLRLAEDLVIQHRTPGAYKTSRYHRIMDRNLWGTRRDD